MLKNAPAAAVALWLLLATNPSSRAQVAAEKGEVVAKRVRAGSYVQYLPRQAPRGLLAVVHGMPTAEEARNIVGLAEKFARRWVTFAEKHGLILVAPAFDDEGFDSVEGDHGGGYRGLFGRYVGADDFLDQVVGQYRGAIPSWDGKFFLYGHSAGGQFANHYCVIHPDRIRAAVVSAAGGFAFPDPDVHWPHGMGPWRITFRWGPEQAKQPIDVRPDPAGWWRAAGLPILVVVGAKDSEEQKPRAGHQGRTRVAYAEQWVAQMNQFARSQRRPGKIKLQVVPDVGHDSAKLTPASQEFLAGVIEGRSK